MTLLNLPVPPAAEGFALPSDALLLGRYPSLSHLLESSGLRPIVLGASKDPNGKVAVLLMHPRESAPRFVVKLAPTPGGAAALRHEAAVLRMLARRLPSPVASTVPVVHGWVEVARLPGLVLGGLPGIPMTRGYYRLRHPGHPDGIRSDLDAAGAWLAGFQAATAEPALPVELDGGLADRLLTRFAGTPGIVEDAAALRSTAESLTPSRTPRTAVHGDFWFGNLLARDGTVLGVVDWEHAATAGEPVRDLVRFAVSYCLYLDRHTRRGREVRGHPGQVAGEWGAPVVHALGGRGWLAEAVEGFLRDGLRRLGADPGRWREAAVAGVAEVAATADHDGFARSHLELFRKLTGRGRAGR